MRANCSWQKRREKSMLKLSRFGLAIVLGLLMGLSLFTSGVFAQSVHSGTRSATTQTAAVTHTQQTASTVLQTTETNVQLAVKPASYSQANTSHQHHWGGWGWGWGWGGYGGWYG